VARSLPRRTRKKKNRFSSDRAYLEALPGATGFLLSIGPAILWFDRATGEEIRTMLDEALSGVQREGIRAESGN
jgi:hypothetical protein